MATRACRLLCRGPSWAISPPTGCMATGRNPTTFIVGAGPVATAIAGALRLAGVTVLGLWARRSAPARAAGSAAGVAAFSSAPPEVLHGVPLARDGTQMASYHCAAALASNYIVAAIDAAAQVLAGAGVSPSQAAQALVPLAEGALRNVVLKGTTDGLTGPVRRGDATTIQRHLEALRTKPEVAEIYRALARRAVEIAARFDGPAAPDKTGLAAIRTLLES